MFARRSASRGNVAYTRSRFHGPGRADDRQVLLDGERGEDVALLRHPADARAGTLMARHPHEVLPGELHRALRLPRGAHQRREQRRLAHAVAAEEREAVALAER